uniref:Large ribosomal subunit protein bL21c n=1 Tax=Astrosyne radiata TaxID=1158023 RepID=A0A2U9NTE4_9STRA|nr:ribosomal protein L21 [Astrosyne radiata]YP_009497673.1 ribosomal protein L21 [Astrosyne radiata]AWT40339.1 ribosomal protein L21 [Astrosyne radiata]AWT40386.1 ribosomal protein L21 [Astrosyne radiata]|mmetsp:Transcript_15893/g.36522  ORF Transcript_15893/g.36522 Transcript_15893/m.36522 type:complete len:117 (+) Transcript_15893:42-392(+)
MLKAVIEQGGKQHYVQFGKCYDISRIPIREGTKVQFYRILLLIINDKVWIGQPYLKDIVVEAIIIKHFKGKKKLVYKMNSKKKTRKKRGYKQLLTRIFINGLRFVVNSEKSRESYS